MRKRTLVLALFGVTAVAGCKELTVPDLNNPSIDELTETPTRVAVLTAAQGLFVDARTGIAGRAGYISETGIIGRESYNFDAADPRFVTELLRDPLDGGNGAFGGAHWGVRYGGFRDADNVINAVGNLTATQMPAAEAEGLRGIAKTFQALDLLLVVNTRDDLGAVVTVNPDPTGDPEPIVDRAAVFTRIISLLDEAATHLGTASFPSDMTFPSGFAGFDDPAGFLEFNRALKARVQVYTGDYAGALTSLGASFLDPAGDMTLGPKHSFGTGSGDATNLLFDPSNLIILAHPSIMTDAQTQPGGELDQRVLDKTESVDEVTDQGGLGLSSDLAFTIYGSATAQVPIIRNEELVLLRAEANIQLGNNVAALTDINAIRAIGGLAPIAQGTWDALTLDEQIDELLYNRRYSLLFEGHRWVDMRRYGRLSDLLLVPSLTVHPRFPFPQSECNARNPRPAQGCPAS